MKQNFYSILRPILSTEEKPYLVKNSIHISWLKHIAFWLIYWIVQSILMSENKDLSFYLAKNLPMVALQVFIVYVNLNILIPYIYSKGQTIWYILAALVLVYLTYSVSFYCIQFVLAKAHSIIPEIYALKFPDEMLRFQFDFWSVFSGSAPYSLAFVCSSANYLNKANQKREQEKSLLTLEKNQAELQFLRSQISPHFLFNSLNNLHYLIGKDQALSEQYTLKLSEVLRYIVYNSKEEKVALEDEVAHIETYIDLMQISIEDPACVNFTYHIGMNNYVISPLLLLTIVENEFKHSGIKYSNKAELSIILNLEKTLFQLEMKNSISASPIKTDNKSTSFDNLRKQLDMIYPDKHEFIFKTDTETAFTSLSIDLN